MQHSYSRSVNPLTPTVAVRVQLWSILSQTCLSRQFLNIRALWRSALRVRVPCCQNYKRWLNPVWLRMLHSCTDYYPCVNCDICDKHLQFWCQRTNYWRNPNTEHLHYRTVRVTEFKKINQRRHRRMTCNIKHWLLRNVKSYLCGQCVCDDLAGERLFCTHCRPTWKVPPLHEQTTGSWHPFSFNNN